MSIIFTSVTLRSRRNPSVIDRTPRPTLHEVRTYFCLSLNQYLERRYIQNLDGFLTLCEDYVAKTYVHDRVVLAQSLFHQFLDNQSPEFIHMDPSLVRECQEKYSKGMQDGEMPTDLLAGMEAFVKEKLQVVLLDYFVSKEFYTACRKPNGFLWRIIKLSSLSYKVCSLLLEKVIRPLLEMCRNGDLNCVPHLSQHNLERFESMFSRFESHFVRLKTSLHLIGYMSKEACIRETLREAHTSHALEKQGAWELEGNARKNY